MPRFDPVRIAAALLAGILALAAPRTAADSGRAVRIDDLGDSVRLRSVYLDATFSLARPEMTALAVDCLGAGRTDVDVLRSNAAPAKAARGSASRKPDMLRVDYGAPGSAAWSLSAAQRTLEFSSTWRGSDPVDALSLTIDTHACYGTLLGVMDSASTVALPALLHLPGFGTLRITAAGSRASLGYASGPGWVRITFPGASKDIPEADYQLEVTTVYPALPKSSERDPRFDGYRRNWLNIFQLNPNRGVLSNNTNSDTCGFCYYEYADIARATPPLAKGLFALDMVRQSLDRVLGGMKTYGMPGYGNFPEESSDTFPSILIAADDYVEGRKDLEWLANSYEALSAMADKMLSTDRTGDGLVKYVATGNSGSWPEGQPSVRPSNWWDTIGFGNEDAYSNALAYRALQGMQKMASMVQQPADAARYGDAAKKIRDAYVKAFLDPATGVLAGWRSADGALHDDYFLFVNGIAILYGLVPEEMAGPILDRLWERMQQVGYSRFRMGLPGNLVPVPRKDYAHKDPRYGGGLREDNADGFQIYENGGATACFSYFMIGALYKTGEVKRADQVLFPIMDAFDRREFEGTGANGRTNDWRKWDGTAEGYEGFLTDNYYTLLAATLRQEKATR